MRDYSLDYKEAQKYILSYKKVYKDNKDYLVLELASGEEFFVLNTKENEEKVLAIMEKQARNAYVKPLDLFDKTAAVVLPGALPLAMYLFSNNPGWFSGITYTTVLSGAFYFPLRALMTKMKEHEIFKMNYFLDYKDRINENLKENKENMKLGISGKLFRKMESIEQLDGKPLILDINNIDGCSLQDLKILKENAERIMYFNEEKEMKLEKK